MGLSLRKLGQDIGGVLSGAGHVAQGVERQVNPFDNGATYSNPAPQHPNGVPPSLISQAPGIAKGVVQFIPQFAENYSNTFANLGNRLGGGQNQTIQQNMGTDALNKKILAFSQATGKNAQLAGDVAQAGLTTVAPAEGKIIEGGVAHALPGVANTVLPRVVSNATIGAGFNAANAAGNGASLSQTAKAAGEGALVGGAFPLAGEAAKPVISAVEKRTPLNAVGAVGKDVSGVGGDNGKLFYHGTNNTDLKALSDLKSGRTTNKSSTNMVYVTENPEIAKNFGKNVVSGQIYGKHLDVSKLGNNAFDPVKVPKDFADYQTSPLLSPRDGRVFEQQYLRGQADNRIIDATPNIHKYLVSKGYSTVTVPRVHSDVNGARSETVILNKDALTRPPTPVSAVGKNVNEPPDFLKPSPDYVPKSPRELAELSPREQMALTKETPLAPQEVNTAANPFKSDIPEVKQGDYKQVIANEQVASNPVQFAGQRWQADMRKLTPDEQTNFWRAVEKPDGNYSPELKQAIASWRNVDDRIHGTSQQLGGNTNYLQNHNLHPWNLPPEFTDHVVNGGDPSKFPGLNNLSRKHMTIAEGEAAGLTLGTDPINEGANYINANASLLKRRAIVKGLGEADGHIDKKTHAFDLGGGNSIPISNEARKAVRGLVRSQSSDNAIIKGLRTGNASLKSSILSLGQFHPINIAALRAAPTLALKGHPVSAVKGLGKTFRPLLPGGEGFVERTKSKALADGMVDKAAKIGMPYGAGGFDTEGSFLKGGVGHRMVFDKQMFGMHDEVVRSVVHDLEKKGIDLNSAEARAAGKAGNNLMGFVNSEVQNIPPQVNRSLGDFLLAKQFTHSKFSQLKTATTKGGVAGSYARANVAANVAATAAIITGIGYLAGQESDNIKDLFLRALIDPAAPTNTKDSKGNTVKLRTPGTDTSDIAKLLGIKLVRNSDGHLGVSWKPGNAPSTVTDFMRARLSPFLSSGVKVATNTTFAGKPLYDPNAEAGVKAEQAGTSLVTGVLPIGAQGLPMVSAIEKHLPGNVQDVLNAQKPGTNPLAKSVGSSFGLTPTTDTTTGKGLQSSQYFSALDEAKSGLNGHEKAALELYAGNKKNPVTGKYDVQPNVNDTVTKARALLDQPKVIDNLITMNAKLADQGQQVDPLWQASKDEIIKVLQYQAMPPGGPDRTHWETQNGDWYNPLADQRTAFFDSLPTGDPNKPQAPIAYPTPSTDVAALQKQFFDITDGKQRAQFMQDHPEVQQQLDAQVDYNNKLREAQGYSALDKFPTASPAVQKIIDTYNSLPQHDGSKGGNKTRSLWITAHPSEYKAMSDYYAKSSLYSLDKEAGQAQFADTEPSQKMLKDLYNLGQYDVVKNKDGTYSLGSSYSKDGSGYSRRGVGGGKYVSKTEAELQNPFLNAIDIGAGGKKNIGKASKPKVSKTVSFKPGVKGYKPKSNTANLPVAAAPTKLKVNLKKSKV